MASKKDWKNYSGTCKTCSTCHYRSDDFTSVCVNPDSEHRADFVMADDTCPQYKEKENE